MAFAENLAALPPVEQLVRLELSDAHGRIEAIENRAGSQGSLRIYAHLLARHGKLDVAAAREGLALFAEHTEDARRHPGRHPNIDRLLAIVAGEGAFTMRPVTHEDPA